MWMCLIVSPPNFCSYQTVELIWLSTSFSNAHYDRASTLQLSCVWMNFLHFWIQHRTESFPLDSDKGAVWTHASTHTLSKLCRIRCFFRGGRSTVGSQEISRPPSENSETSWDHHVTAGKSLGVEQLFSDALTIKQYVWSWSSHNPTAVFSLKVNIMSLGFTFLAINYALDFNIYQLDTISHKLCTTLTQVFSVLQRFIIINVNKTFQSSQHDSRKQNVHSLIIKWDR